MSSLWVSEEVTTKAELLLIPEAPLHPLKVSSGQLWVPAAGMVWQVEQRELGALHKTKTPPLGSCFNITSVPRIGISFHFSGKKGESKVQGTAVIRFNGWVCRSFMRKAHKAKQFKLLPLFTETLTKVR